MARARIRTELSLDRWAYIMGLNPLHFNGIYIPDQPITVCAQPWMQYPHQAVDRLGREDVAQAISQAEMSMEAILGYRMLPSWEVDEWQETIRPYSPEKINLSVTDIRGFGQNVQVDQGYFLMGGRRAKSLITPDVVVAYTDKDGDTYKETATITVNTAVTDPCEIAVYFPASNTGTEIIQGDDQWQVRPINVSIVGGVATITMQRHQLVRPEAYEHLTPMPSDSQQRGVDGMDDINFFDMVDVVRVYNDPSQQVMFLWENSGGCSCGSNLGSGCATCAYAVQNGCLLQRGKPRNSIIVYQPAEWNVDTLSFDGIPWAMGQQPNITRLWYYAGFEDKSLPCPRTQMEYEFERTVAYYAASLLDRSVCECDNIQAWIERLRTDMAIDVSGVSRHALADSELSNPFGTRVGALQAWRKCIDRARGKNA